MPADNTAVNCLNLSVKFFNVKHNVITELAILVLQLRILLFGFFSSYKIKLFISCFASFSTSKRRTKN